MGDVDDADAVRPQVLDDGEQMRDLGVVERRGRLVHDEDLGVERQRLGDLDQLLARHRQVADLALGVDVDLHADEQRRRVGVGLGFVGEPAEAAARLAADEDVLRRREVAHQVQFLMDDADAEVLRGARAGQRHWLAVDEDLAGIRLVDPRQHLHQGRLAGAVFAHQRMDLAGAQVETRAAQRMDARKVLFDAAHLDERGRFRRRRRLVSLAFSHAAPLLPLTC